MTAMYDGIDTRVPVRCLGCAMPEHSGGVLVHRCAGNAQLLPAGGWCECGRPGCGPNPTGQKKIGGHLWGQVRA